MCNRRVLSEAPRCGRICTADSCRLKKKSSEVGMFGATWSFESGGPKLESIHVLRSYKVKANQSAFHASDSLAAPLLRKRKACHRGKILLPATARNVNPMAEEYSEMENA